MDNMIVFGVAHTAAAHRAGLTPVARHAHAGWAGAAAAERKRPAAADPSVDGGST
jgi:hypothetical protein